MRGDKVSRVLIPRVLAVECRWETSQHRGYVCVCSGVLTVSPLSRVVFFLLRQVGRLDYEEGMDGRRVESVLKRWQYCGYYGSCSWVRVRAWRVGLLCSLD